MSDQAGQQPWDPSYYPYAGHYAGHYAPYPGVFPPPPPPARRRRGVATAVVAVVAAGAVFGAGVLTGRTSTTSGNGAIAAGPNITPGGTGGGSGSGSGNGSGAGNGNPFGKYPFGSGGSSGSSGSQSSSKATSTQSVGVVDIYTQLGYSGSAAAGTGLVLNSDGEILTNNHVISGATKMRVVVVSTGKSYTAKVVGDVPSKDVALIKVQNASGLQTANIGNSDSVSIGDAVTGVGNAGGSGGTPSAAKGKITALDKTITASDENGAASERLHDVIVTDAPIQAGDSGGPLYNAGNQVIGMDTAASTSGSTAGFAIPINDAIALVNLIRTGVETSAVHIGYPGFMGIEMLPKTKRPVIYTVIRGGPADSAGLASGDVITKVNGNAVNSQTKLRSTVSTMNPGSKITITYTDQSGTSHSTSLTLIAGPAD